MYFTGPLGKEPNSPKLIVPAQDSRMDTILQKEDLNGNYQLYQCVTDGNEISNIIPLFRTSTLLLPRVYLDTSVVSYLKQDDAPEKTAITQKFWNLAWELGFPLYLSDIALEELLRCPEPKRGILFDFLREVNYTKVTSSEYASFDRLVRAVMDTGILPKRSIADISHIATALCAGCEVIASWDFKHMSNQQTVSGIRTVAIEHSCNAIDIMTPEQIMEVYL